MLIKNYQAHPSILNTVLSLQTTSSQYGFIKTQWPSVVSLNLNKYLLLIAIETKYLEEPKMDRKGEDRFVTE